MAFWGVEVAGNKPKAYVPPPEASRLHISQATLSIDATGGERLGLSCKIGDDTFLICSLREGSQETCSLDLIVDSYAEFSLVTKKGGNPKGSIHLAGYVMTEEEGEDDDEYGMDGLEDLDPEELESLTDEQVRALVEARNRFGLTGGEDDELDSEDDSEEDDSEEDSDEEEGLRPKSSVIIEELPNDEDEPQTSGAKITQIKATPGKIEKKTVKVEEKKASSEEEMPDAEDSEDEDDLEGEEDSDEEDDEEALKEEILAIGKKRKAEAEKQLAAKAAASKQSEPAQKKQKAQEPKTPVGKAKQNDPGVKTPATKQKEAQAVQKTPATKTKQNEAQATPQTTDTAKPLKGIKKYDNGFIVENVSMGNPTGKLAKGGKKVVVKYIGKLAKNGKVFDQTKGNKTFGFRLGVGEVIKGWDQGVAGMRVGDKRKLTVPPQMAYGTKGVPPTIPGNATLVFDVELVDVKG